MPRSAVERLATELKTVLASADVKAKFSDAGADVQPRGPAEFAAYVKAEAERWAALIAKRGIKLD